MTTRINKTHKVLSEKGSALSKYKHIIVGDDSWFYLIYFELCTLLGKFPGALGILLRKLFWPRLFGSCGNGVMFADNIVLRQPKKIHLGNNVIISEFCVLDARHDDEEKVIKLDDDVMLSTNVMISCKNGCIEIGKRTGLSAQTIIHATNDCPVSIGDDVIIGPQSYISAGGNYHFDRLDMPIRDQGINPDGGMKAIFARGLIFLVGCYVPFALSEQTVSQPAVERTRQYCRALHPPVDYYGSHDPGDRGQCL